MALLVAFTLWLLGSTSWTVPSFSCMKALIAEVAWLSVTLKVGLYPKNLRCMKTCLKALRMSLLEVELMGMTKL